MIRQASGGDRASFDALLDPLVEPAYRLAYGMLFDRAEAEDMVQDAALRAWGAMARFREGSDFRPWFLTIVANCCRTRRRRRRLEIGWLGANRAAAAPAGSTEASLDLRRALEALPGQDRALLILHYHMDLPLAEVASVLRISNAAAKARLHRILGRLRSSPALVTEVP